MLTVAGAKFTFHPLLIAAPILTVNQLHFAPEMKVRAGKGVLEEVEYLPQASLEVPV